MSVVTNIGLDHVQILGDTLEEIAAEKAGIFKPGTEAVFGKMDAAARRVLINGARSWGFPGGTPGSWRRGPGLEGQIPGEVTGLRPGTLRGLPEAEHRHGAAVFDVITERCPEMFGEMSEEERRKILLEA